LIGLKINVDEDRPVIEASQGKKSFKVQIE